MKAKKHWSFVVVVVVVVVVVAVVVVVVVAVVVATLNRSPNEFMTIVVLFTRKC